MRAVGLLVTKVGNAPLVAILQSINRWSQSRHVRSLDDACSLWQKWRQCQQTRAPNRRYPWLVAGVRSVFSELWPKIRLSAPPFPIPCSLLSVRHPPPLLAQLPTTYNYGMLLRTALLSSSTRSSVSTCLACPPRLAHTHTNSVLRQLALRALACLRAACQMDSPLQWLQLAKLEAVYTSPTHASGRFVHFTRASAPPPLTSTGRSGPPCRVGLVGSGKNSDAPEHHEGGIAVASHLRGGQRTRVNRTPVRHDG